MLESVVCLCGQEEEDTDMGEHYQFQPQTAKWPFLWVISPRAHSEWQKEQRSAELATDGPTLASISILFYLTVIEPPHTTLVSIWHGQHITKPDIKTFQRAQTTKFP